MIKSQAQYIKIIATFSMDMHCHNVVDIKQRYAITWMCFFHSRPSYFG